jgi:hypothetical protein
MAPMPTDPLARLRLATTISFFAFPNPARNKFDFLLPAFL